MYIDARVKYAVLLQSFEKLSKDGTKEQAIDWINKEIPSCPIREKLLYYLKRDDVYLKRLYFHAEKSKVIFYFKVFDASKRGIKRKKIALVTLVKMKKMLYKY